MDFEAVLILFYFGASNRETTHVQISEHLWRRSSSDRRIFSTDVRVHVSPPQSMAGLNKQTEWIDK